MIYFSLKSRKTVKLWLSKSLRSTFRYKLCQNIRVAKKAQRFRVGYEWIEEIRFWKLGYRKLNIVRRSNGELTNSVGNLLFKWGDKGSKLKKVSLSRPYVRTWQWLHPRHLTSLTLVMALQMESLFQNLKQPSSCIFCAFVPWRFWGMGLCLSCSLLCPQHLAHCQHLMNVCWVNDLQGSGETKVDSAVSSVHIF